MSIAVGPSPLFCSSAVVPSGATQDPGQPGSAVVQNRAERYHSLKAGASSDSLGEFRTILPAQLHALFVWRPGEAQSIINELEPGSRNPL